MVDTDGPVAVAPKTTHPVRRNSEILLLDDRGNANSAERCVYLFRVDIRSHRVALGTWHIHWMIRLPSTFSPSVSEKCLLTLRTPPLSFRKSARKHALRRRGGVVLHAIRQVGVKRLLEAQCVCCGA